MSPDIQARIVRMKAHMKTSELYAHYWIAQATTGAAKRRNISRMDRQLTDDEKIDDAMNTAINHIQNIRDTAENIAALVENDGDDQ